MKIKENNRPAKIEITITVIIFVFLGFLLLGKPIIMFTYYSLFAFLLISLYLKKIELIIEKESIIINLKIFGLVYKNISIAFDNVCYSSTSISFYKDYIEILKFDCGLAIEQKDVHSIEINLPNRNFSIGNESNALSIYNEIENYFKKQGALSLPKE